MLSMNCGVIKDVSCHHGEHALNRCQFDTVEWRSSSSCENGACVEVAFAGDDVIAVRDSEDPHGVVTFGLGHWRDFVAKVKRGAFEFA